MFELIINLVIVQLTVKATGTQLMQTFCRVENTLVLFRRGGWLLWCCSLLFFFLEKHRGGLILPHLCLCCCTTALPPCALWFKGHPKLSVKCDFVFFLITAHLSRQYIFQFKICFYCVSIVAWYCFSLAKQQCWLF